MGKKTALKRVAEELEDAQAEIETARPVEGSLGEMLVNGFRSLLNAIAQLARCFDEHDHAIAEHDRALKIALYRIGELESQMRGLKVSRGKAVVSKKKALEKLEAAKTALNGISVH